MRSLHLCLHLKHHTVHQTRDTHRHIKHQHRCGYHESVPLEAVTHEVDAPILTEEGVVVVEELVGEEDSKNRNARADNV